MPRGVMVIVVGAMMLLGVNGGVWRLYHVFRAVFG